MSWLLLLQRKLTTNLGRRTRIIPGYGDSAQGLHPFESDKTHAKLLTIAGTSVPQSVTWRKIVPGLSAIRKLKHRGCCATSVDARLKAGSTQSAPALNPPQNFLFPPPVVI